MKHTILLLAFWCAVPVIYCQTGNPLFVKYIENNGGFKDKPVYLFADNRNALFVSDSITVATPMSVKTEEKQVDEWHHNITIKAASNSHSSHFYLTANSNDVLMETQFNKKDYWVKDSLPALNWTLKNDTKQIGKYLCKSASLDFRGSKLTAYYTTEIPVPFGPYKFKGLPGLILAIYEDAPTDKKITRPLNSWVAEEIIYPGEKYRALTINIKGKTIITYKSMQEKWKEADEILQAKLHSSIAAMGSTLIKTESTIENPTVEQKYEWEN